MPQIRIERTPIKNYGLGFFGADHLLLTYVVDEFATNLVQDNWYVIEGLKGGVSGGRILGVEGTDGRTTLSDANGGLTGSALVQQIGTPATRNSRVIEFNQGAFSAWETMADLAEDIDGQFLPYVFYTNPAQPIVTSNSSSVIASLLHYAGVNIADVLPIDSGRYTSGASTLLGTSGNDEMFVTSQFKMLLGGRGSDILHGSNGSDRINGGTEADYFRWSAGFDHIHGGQYYLDYARDGEDVVGYDGAGEVRIEYNPAWIAHKMPNYVAIYAGGKDYLYSIERIEWADDTDTIILGKGVQAIVDDVLFDLKGSTIGGGDKSSMLDATEGVIVNVVDADTLSLQATSASNGAAMFIKSAEWIEGSDYDDRIYAGPGLRVVEGAGGDDLIDARLDVAFSGGSPSGYDIEIDGGAGSDTILSSEGRTLATGGGGGDRFVLTTVNTGAGTPEFVIADAEADDRLFVPYNFFNGSGGGFEGSQLMPVLGAMFPFDILQDPEGTGSLLFEWQLMADVLHGDSQVPGLIDFIGRFTFTLEGNDLLIHVQQGTTSVVNLAGEGLPPDYFTIIETDPEIEALIRVVDFQVGDLGIQFHDPGEPQPTPDGDFYPNWDAAVAAMLDNGEMLDPFAARPSAPTYDPSGTGGSGETEVSGGTADDTITASQSSTIHAGDGNDTVIASAFADWIDGGSGSDSMTGGAGDDTYVVDGAGDTVVEIAGPGEGNDRVIAEVDFVLPDNVENLELAGVAASGIGNALANQLLGNERDNLLDGGAGNDTLSGGLGNDILLGGAGNDTYVYFSGEGDDLVIDNGGTADLDTLAFGLDIAPSDVTLYRSAAALDDLILAVAGGGRVIVRDYAGGSGSGLELIAFGDGTVWTRATIEALGAAAPIVGNDPPQAVADDALMINGPLGFLPGSLLLSNDRDPGGDPLGIVSISDAVGGIVTLEADGRLRIETTVGYEGDVSFTYTIADTAGGTASARATIAVIPNYDPVAIGSVADQVSPEDVFLDVTLPAGIFGDADGDTLAISATLADGAPLPAWLAFDYVTGRISGTPPANFNGALDIRVEASDGLAVAAHVFTLTITPENDAPSAVADPGFATAAGEALVIAPSVLLANDADIDGDALTIVAVGNATGGTVVVDGDGSIRFTPAAGFSGAAGFTYTVADGNGASAVAAVSITVAAPSGQTFTGTSGNDTLTGTSGNDTFTLIGDGGTDTIDGGGGIDTVRGSVYNDIVRLTASPANFISVEIIDGGGGNDRILGGSGDDTIDASPFDLISIELIDGGAGNDTIIGSAGGDTISGNAGNDALSGGLGDDVFTLAGDGGNDTIDGGGGIDTIRGSIYNDNIRIAAGVAAISGIEIIDGGAGNDRILGGSGADAIDLTGITLIGIEGIDGGAGNDTILGSDGGDTISGNVGNDFLSGGLGDDVFTLAGDGGNDIIVGGGGFDTVRGSIYNDIVRIGGSASLTSVELIDGGDGWDRVLGTGASDTIDLGGVALTGIERVDAGGGNDTIVTSLSDDVLAGGAGSDSFVFRSDGGHDVIVDFTPHSLDPSGGDRLDLRGLGFTDTAAVLAVTALTGGDAVINVDGATSIRLVGVLPGALGNDDFLL